MPDARRALPPGAWALGATAFRLGVLPGQRREVRHA